MSAFRRITEKNHQRLDVASSFAKKSDVKEGCPAISLHCCRDENFRELHQDLSGCAKKSQNKSLTARRVEKLEQGRLRSMTRMGTCKLVEPDAECIERRSKQCCQCGPRASTLLLGGGCTRCGPLWERAIQVLNMSPADLRLQKRGGLRVSNCRGRDSRGEG